MPYCKNNYDKTEQIDSWFALSFPCPVLKFHRTVNRAMPFQHSERIFLFPDQKLKSLMQILSTKIPLYVDLWQCRTGVRGENVSLWGVVWRGTSDSFSFLLSSNLRYRLLVTYPHPFPLLLFQSVVYKNLASPPSWRDCVIIGREKGSNNQAWAG